MNYIFEKKSTSNFIRLFFLLVMVILISPNLIFSQTGIHQKGNPPDPRLHNEVEDDAYVPDLRDSQGRSPAFKYSMRNITTTQVNVDANGQNIVGDAANEPSIAIDRNNPNRMAIGWRQFNTITNNFRQAGYGFTTNGGQTWTFPGVIEPGVFRSDPVLGSDADGNFYYNSLAVSPTYFCDVFKSSSGGSSWGDKAYAQGGDKQWMTIDKTSSSGKGHIYAFWTSYYSVCSPGFFTRSTDGGAFFEDCVTILPNDPYWGTLAVASNGDLFAGGAAGGDFLVARSSNAKIAGQIVSWDMATTVNLDGTIKAFSGGPNPGGLLGQTIIAIDTSGGPYHDNIYLLCSVERNSNPDPLDVMFSRSTNGGVSWSSPYKINDDPGTSAYQWFGTMSVAPTGRIDVVWLDTRDNPGTFLSALYYSFSMDGGVTWSQNERLSDFFNPHVGWPSQNKMGDYFDMISDFTGAHLAWAATFNGEQDIYYSYVTDSTFIPVELLSFTASSNGREVILNWSTATELNNQLFEIQRGFDGSDFATVGFVNGKGTTTQRQEYIYKDKINVDGKYLYRLKQIDYLGSYQYSDIIEIDLRVFNSYLLEQNHPNPFNPSTTIGYGLKEKSSVKITVLNSIGEEVALLLDEEKESGYHTIEFNAANLPSGVYFYRLKAGNFIETKKMILLR
ncbi:MAG TPA: T9SS type A sorting domain-containing protein [Ignavibacteriaceae bacterium]|nr:T9SS type A sorting domain-containing protein [Ignavibacteriaceae bacterium]